MVARREKKIITVLAKSDANLIGKRKHFRASLCTHTIAKWEKSKPKKKQQYC